jgi:raffinose/stachyose/melibiose transport system permease protein
VTNQLTGHEVPSSFAQAVSRMSGTSKWVRAAIGYGFLIPSLILYVIFIIYPFFDMIWLSLHRSRGLVPQPEFVGLDNYVRLVNDGRFWAALQNNLIWSALTLAIPLLFGFLLAVVLARGNVVGMNLFRVLYFIPVTFSQVVIAIVFIWIFQPRWGAVNTVLEAVGLDELTRAWLGDPEAALYALIIAGVWGQIGLFMVIFLAGLQKIPVDLYDAAKVDGANPTQELRHVTLPGLRQEITFMVVLSMIISFKVFDIVQVLTRGGPFRQTEVIGFYIYELAFNQFNWGYASTVAVMLTLFIFIISSIVVVIRIRGD